MKQRPRRNRHKLTFTDEESEIVNAMCERLYRFMPTATALRRILIEAAENIDTFEEAVTRVPNGPQRAPTGPCPSPARTGTDQNELKKKNKSVHLEPGMVKRITEHLNATAGTTYRANGAKLGELIRVRVNAGASEADFFTVIDKKTREWAGTEMAKYLRPITLFGPKFDDYLGQAEAIVPKKPSWQAAKDQDQIAIDASWDKTKEQPHERRERERRERAELQKTNGA